MSYEKRRGTPKRNISTAMLKAVALERNSYRLGISETRRRTLLQQARALRRTDAAVKARKERKSL
jgi:hypothetical protein